MISALLLSFGCLQDPTPAGSASEAPPNVLVLLIDDLGLEMIRMYERDNSYPEGTAEAVPLAYPRTPNIDRLAEEGVRFRQARVPPSCSATRATLLTGRYPFRHGIGEIVRPADASALYGRAATLELGVGAGNREWTVAHLARAAGLRSFMAGKWHLALLEKSPALDGAPGRGWEHIRVEGGFDDYWAVWGNLPGWPAPEAALDEQGVERIPGYFNFVVGSGGEAKNQVGTYLTTAQVDRVLGFAESTGRDPWLVYCAFNAVHDPYQLPPADLIHSPELLERCREEMSGRADDQGEPSVWPIYLAMVEALDTEIGRLVAGLEELGQLDRTVIFLLADNGTPRKVLQHGIEREHLDLGPVIPRLLVPGRERLKHTVWEGGVRVPLIVRGPVVGAAGRTTDVLVDAPDLFATIAEILGVAPSGAGIPDDHALDGISFLPVLRAAEAEASHPRRMSFVEHFEPNGDPEQSGTERGQSTVERGLVLETDEGRFKLVRNMKGAGGDLLFQLADAHGNPVDPWELDSLSPSDRGNRKRLDQLRQALRRLLKSEPRD